MPPRPKKTNPVRTIVGSDAKFTTPKPTRRRSKNDILTIHTITQTYLLAANAIIGVALLITTLCIYAAVAG